MHSCDEITDRTLYQHLASVGMHMPLQSSSSPLHLIRTRQESPKSCPPKQPGAHHTANPFFVQLPTTCPTRSTQPAHFKPNSLTTRLECNQTVRPFYTRVRVESLNLQFLGIWYLRLTKIHPMLKLLRDPPIFKFSRAWACVKWPSSKWNIKGGAQALDILNYLMEID